MNDLEDYKLKNKYRIDIYVSKLNYILYPHLGKNYLDKMNVLLNKVTNDNNNIVNIFFSKYLKGKFTEDIVNSILNKSIYNNIYLNIYVNILKRINDDHENILEYILKFVKIYNDKTINYIKENNCDNYEKLCEKNKLLNYYNNFNLLLCELYKLDLINLSIIKSNINNMLLYVNIYSDILYNIGKNNKELIDKELIQEKIKVVKVLKVKFKLMDLIDIL